jgi:hypothetical protein
MPVNIIIWFPIVLHLPVMKPAMEQAMTMSQNKVKWIKVSEALL